jgi:integrase
MGKCDTLSVKKFFPYAKASQMDTEWEKFVRHIKCIWDAQRNDVPHMQSTVQWFEKLPKKLANKVHKKLLAYDPAFVQTKHDLDEYIDLYAAYRAEQNTSLATDAAVMRHVELLRRRCPSDITRIDTGMLTDLLAELADERNYAPSTLARIAISWNTFFGWLMHIQRAISLNPCDELPKEISTREKDTIRTEWIDAMVRSCRTDEERYWLRLLQWTGCRLSEGLQLRIADFDFEKGRILITESKNDRVRVNPLYPAIGQYLYSLFKGREPTELVLKRMTYNTCYKWLRSMQDELGLPHWSPPYHAFRSTRANQLAADPNITPQQAGMLLGHSAVVARKNYLSVDDLLLDKLRAAA